MDDQWTRRVWPPVNRNDTAPANRNMGDLPPSASLYGTPTAPPPRRRRPRPSSWLIRLVVALIAVGAAGTVIGVTVTAILRLVDTPPRAAAPVTVSDTLAGVTYELPAGWNKGMVAPVTGFTSVGTNGDLATVMARPAEPVDPAELRTTVLELSDLYSRLLLHGDQIAVVDDHALTVGDSKGYTQALQAEYQDVVNQPAFLRVTLLTSPDGKSTVLLGLSQSGDPKSRAQIDAIMTNIR